MTQEDYYRWAKFIWNNALQKSPLVFAWGFDPSKIKVIDNGTEFYCCGLKMQGWIRIQHQGTSNTFNVRITPDDSQENPILVEGVMLQQLAFVINDSIRHYQECQNCKYEEMAIAS